ncbi:MAG: hypothetical protein P8179_15725 [Candidatus Thiodiazotropha sp.]|jgi:hypothetical protein
MSLFRQLLEVYDIPIFSKNKLLKKLRSDWGNPVSKWRDYSNIEIFKKLTEGYHKQGLIDDKTWYDLGMNALFGKIDTTLTEVGQQVLYQKMHLLEVDEASLKQQYDLAYKIKVDQDLREQLQLALYPLSQLSVKSTVKLLFDRFHYINLPRMLIVGWGFFSIVILFCSIYYKSSIFYILIFFMIIANLLVVRPKYLDATDKSAYPLHCMNKMLQVISRLATKKSRISPTAVQ